MRRQASAKRKAPDTPHGAQGTLTGFFKPKTAAPIARTTPPSSVPAGDSSSSEDDELAALDQLLPKVVGERRKSTRLSSLRSPPQKQEKTGQGRRGSESPPPIAPSYNGSFNLAALLADREDRRNEKVLVAKLECDAPPKEAGLTQANGKRRAASTAAEEDAPAPDRVQALLETQKVLDERTFYSVFAASTNLERSPDVQQQQQKRILEQMPVDLCIETERQLIDFVLSGHGTAYVRWKGWDGLPSELPHIFLDELTRCGDVRSATHISAALDRTSTLPRPDLERVFSNLGLHNGPLREKVTLDSWIHTKERPGQDPLSLQKLIYLLQHLPKTIGVTTNDDDDGELNRDVTYCRQLFNFALALSQDSTYGSHLVAPIRDLLTRLLQRFAACGRSPPCLSDMTDAPWMQVQVMRSLPTATPEALDHMQRTASHAFLGTTPPPHHDDSGREESWDARLVKFTKHLSTARPYHPLDTSTHYTSLTSGIALLSLATSCVPPTSETETLALVARLRYLHGQIVDAKGAFLDRSEAKAGIQRLADRLKYTLDARRKKANVFDQFIG